MEVPKSIGPGWDGPGAIPAAIPAMHGKNGGKQECRKGLPCKSKATGPLKNTAVPTPAIVTVPVPTFSLRLGPTGKTVVGFETKLIVTVTSVKDAEPRLPDAVAETVYVIVLCASAPLAALNSTARPTIRVARFIGVPSSLWIGVSTRKMQKEPGAIRI